MLSHKNNLGKINPDRRDISPPGIAEGNLDSKQCRATLEPESTKSENKKKARTQARLRGNPGK